MYVFTGVSIMLEKQGALHTIPPPIPGKIAVVGPCASGKSTLIECLRAYGYDAHQCGQEHSNVPNMWQHLTRPECLIFLDVSPDVALSRREMSHYAMVVHLQQTRLEHARQHADLIINTDPLSPQQVCQAALQFLQKHITPTWTCDCI